MRKSIGATLALALVVTGLVATSPAIQADASVSWPLTPTGINPVAVVANGDDLAMFGCDWDTSIPNFVSVVHNGEEATAMQNDTTYACGTGNKIVGPDGTIYLNLVARSGSDGNVIAAIKNGHVKWVVNPSVGTSCPYVSVHDPAFNSLSIGADGNLFMIANENWRCDRYVLGLNSDTGGVLTGFPFSIGSSLAAGASTSLWNVNLWTYDTYIMAVDPAGMQREFSYAGVEDTGARYDFSAVTTLNSQDEVYANSSGRVFYVTQCNTTGRIYYHDTSGSGNVARSDCGSSHLHSFKVSANGDLIGYTDTYFRLYDVDGSGSTNYSTVAPTGYTASGGGYSDVFQDTNGDFIAVQTVYATGSSYPSISVDLIDGTTGVGTNLSVFVGSSSYKPYVFEPVVLGGITIGNDSIYVATADMLNWSQYKVLRFNFGSSGFGGAENPSYGLSGTIDSEREYVALGDSFSSGEGIEPFLPSTHTPGTNECHRSELAYPMFLDKDSSMDLNLTAFAACSGATTDTLLNGGTGVGTWNEGTQIDALKSSTDIVTLTIGGNDVGFVSVLMDCAYYPSHTGIGWGCASDTGLNDDLDERMAALAGTAPSTVYEPANGREIHSILSVLEAIDSVANGAEIYIAGYPHLFGDSMGDFDENEAAPEGVVCEAGFATSFAYSDTQWMNARADELNDIIEDAVDTAQLEDINATYVPTAFGTHGLCDSNASYVNLIWLDNYIPQSAPNPGSLHPNDGGASIGYGVPFSYYIG